MSDYNDFLFPDDRENPSDNPTWFDPLPDDEQIQDPALEVYNQVRAILNIDDYDDVIIEAGDASPENIRGNRYFSVVDALVDLFSAGILNFSQVTIDDLEIGIAVEDNTNPR